MRTGDALTVEAIVNSGGVPLVNLRWDQLAAQLPVAQARDLAVQMLRVCEWADVDAASLAALRRVGFDDATIGGFMAMMREERGGSEKSSAVASAKARQA